MMSNPNISYRPLCKVSPEHELDALAAVYKIAINRYLETKAAGEHGGEDAKERSESAFRAKQRLP